MPDPTALAAAEGKALKERETFASTLLVTRKIRLAFEMLALNDTTGRWQILSAVVVAEGISEGLDKEGERRLKMRLPQKSSTKVVY